MVGNDDVLYIILLFFADQIVNYNIFAPPHTVVYWVHTHIVPSIMIIFIIYGILITTTGAATTVCDG